MTFESQGAIVAVKYDGGILISADRTVPHGKVVRKPGMYSHFLELCAFSWMGVSGTADDFEKILTEIFNAISRKFGRWDWDKRPFDELYAFIKDYLAKRRPPRKPAPGAKVVVTNVNSDKTTFLAAIDLDGTLWEGDVLCTDPEHINVDELNRVVGRSRDEVLEAVSRVWLDQKVVHRFARGDIELLDVVGGQSAMPEYLKIPGVNALHDLTLVWG